MRLKKKVNELKIVAKDKEEEWSEKIEENKAIRKAEYEKKRS
ncbi:hypothetical protein OL548_28045 [Lysinibacillus sp. MHQ-1]|nr:hypothetical protein OL548_28045 [Lysinibacillus sp. MHQ-1]